MSRLYDRAMAHGCRALSARDVVEPSDALDDLREEVRRVAQVRLGREPTQEELAEQFLAFLGRLRQRSSDFAFDTGQLEDAVVVAADEVVDLFNVSVTGGKRQLEEIVDVLAPSTSSGLSFKGPRTR